jgi:hypothetical protein
MTTIDDMRSKFPNRRHWRDFIASVHDTVTLPCAATYPMVMDALRSGTAWFSLGAVRASTWLVAQPAELKKVILARIEA